jgi:hypothetical protein
MKPLTPMRAIRAKCLDCACQQPKEVRECRITTCALRPYRLGKRPVKVDDSQAIVEVGDN